MAARDDARRILVIDEDPSTHEDLRRVFADQACCDPFAFTYFQVEGAQQGREAIRLVKQSLTAEKPFAVAMVSTRLQGELGTVATIARLLEADRELQLAICASRADHLPADILQRFGATGRVMLHKMPFDLVETSLLVTSLAEKWHLTHAANLRLKRHAEQLQGARKVMSVIGHCFDELDAAHEELRFHSVVLTQRLQQREIEVVGTRDLTMFALAQLADSRDPETGEHLLRMRAYAQALAEHLSRRGPYKNDIDRKFLADFFRSTPLHDIGKVGIPDSILLKPGTLTPEEFAIMKRHTVIGAEALQKAASHSNFGGFLDMAARIARSHHERFDGSGYPDGLSSTGIPLCARITAVADVFDALTSSRVYKDAMSPDEARKLIMREANRHFDPVIVDAFRQRYPEMLEIKDAIDGGEPSSASPVVCYDEPLPLFESLSLSVATSSV